MRSTFSRFPAWLLLLGWLPAGCLSAQNPSYFPYLLPTEPITRTHAKPPGFGYFSNFDPYACRLEVRPLEATLPVRTAHVLIATVYDKDAKPRRGRRVEWLVEGVGNIIEVDESGCLPGRGAKIDNKYAVSYTDYFEHTITRGNNDPRDDFVIRPGQTWCVVSSAVEGDTSVTAYAPGIADWERQKVVVTKHWIDAHWQWPVPAVARAGTEQPLLTVLTRFTDQRPLAGYRVRYRIADGSPAVLLARPAFGSAPAALGPVNGTRDPGAAELVVTSDLTGQAGVTLAQSAAQAGTTRVVVEIIRPPDPGATSGVGIVIARGETTVQWQAPQVSLSLTGPEAVPVGQPVTFTVTVGNTGPVPTPPVTVREALPDGLAFDRTEPAAERDGNQLVWRLPGLAAGQQQELQVVGHSTRTGILAASARAVSADGARAEGRAETRVTAARLLVKQAMPAAGVVGVPLAAPITVTNTGNSAAANVVLTVEFDPGLEHEAKANRIEWPVGRLDGGQTQTVPLTIVPRRAGRLADRVSIAADGNLSDRVEAAVEVRQTGLTVQAVGPPRRYLGRDATFDLHVANAGEVPLTNVVVTDRLPQELTFRSATNDGQFRDGAVQWNLGELKPGEQRLLQVTAACAKLAERATQRVVVRAEPGVEQAAEAVVEILGVPAVSMKLTGPEGVVEVGTRVTYAIEVINQGSLPADGVEVVATLPAGLRPVSGDGARPGRIEQQAVHFPPADALAPGQSLPYRVEAEAVTAGDARFRAELRSPVLRSPVVKEEATRLVPRLSGGPGAGIPK